MVNIKQVARRAGVSTATVSHVINKSTYVTPETTRKVEDAVRELGYSPSPIARGMKSKKTKTIGLMIDSVSSPFFAEVAKGVEIAAHLYGYNTILCNLSYDSPKESTYVTMLRQRWVDGVIYSGMGKNMKEILSLAEQKIPVVVVDKPIKGVPFSSVIIDNEKGAYEATHHLVELGHKRIAHITGLRELPNTPYRQQGYKKCLLEAGLSYEEQLAVRGDYTAEGGYQAVPKLLALGERPTAIFADNDLMAIGAIRALQDRGLRVPEDVAVIGFDDIPVAAFMEPPLSTIRQPMHEMGKLGLEILVKTLKGEITELQEIILDTKLIVRSSTVKTAPREPLS